MLRQVTKDSVTVWVAVKTKTDATLTNYDGDTAPARCHLGNAKRPRAAIWKNLFIVAVTARTTEPLVESATDAYERPHQVSLTGDQIYADEVIDVLLAMLMDASDTLMGWTELFAAHRDPAGSTQRSGTCVMPGGFKMKEHLDRGKASRAESVCHG
jgi:hypothetical protein